MVASVSSQFSQIKLLLLLGHFLFDELKLSLRLVHNFIPLIELLRVLNLTPITLRLILLHATKPVHDRIILEDVTLDESAANLERLVLQ